MSIEVIITLAGIIIAWLVLTALLKIFKVGITTALTVIALLLILQLVFGIQSSQIWQQMQSTAQDISQFVLKVINNRF